MFFYVIIDKCFGRRGEGEGEAWMKWEKGETWRVKVENDKYGMKEMT